MKTATYYIFSNCLGDSLNGNAILAKVEGIEELNSYYFNLLKSVGDSEDYEFIGAKELEKNDFNDDFSFISSNLSDMEESAIFFRSRYNELEKIGF